MGEAHALKRAISRWRMLWLVSIVLWVAGCASDVPMNEPLHSAARNTEYRLLDVRRIRSELRRRRRDHGLCHGRPGRRARLRRRCNTRRAQDGEDGERRPLACSYSIIPRMK
jgi:hypothetical protein